MKTFYLHTIDGKPGCFSGDQICFLPFHGKAYELATSLSQIRKEQEATKRYRLKNGWLFVSRRYGHRRVAIPNGEVS